MSMKPKQIKLLTSHEISFEEKEMNEQIPKTQSPNHSNHLVKGC